MDSPHAQQAVRGWDEVRNQEVNRQGVAGAHCHCLLESKLVGSWSYQAEASKFSGLVQWWRGLSHHLQCKHPKGAPSCCTSAPAPCSTKYLGPAPKWGARMKLLTSLWPLWPAGEQASRWMLFLPFLPTLTFKYINNNKEPRYSDMAYSHLNW